MLKRILTGAGLIAVTLGFFALRFLDFRWFYIYLAIISIFSTFEMVRAMGERLLFFQKAIVLAGQVLSLCGFFFAEQFSFAENSGIIMAFAAYVLAGLALITFAVFSKSEVSLESLGVSILCLCYPGVLHLTLFMLNGIGQNSLLALVLVFAVSPLADTFAFFTGIIFKGKKLCPTISPKKTISGAIGGLLGGTGGGVLVYVILNAQNAVEYHGGANPYVYFALVGLVAAFLTEIGDLAESYIKRKVGIKDMGNILPGHGGMLDRVDGMSFAAPFIWLAVSLL